MTLDFTFQNPHFDILFMPWLPEIATFQGSKLEEVFEQSDVDGNHVLQNDEETTFEPGIFEVIFRSLLIAAQVNLVEKNWPADSVS